MQTLRDEQPEGCGYHSDSDSEIENYALPVSLTQRGCKGVERVDGQMKVLMETGYTEAEAYNLLWCLSETELD